MGAHNSVATVPRFNTLRVNCVHQEKITITKFNNVAWMWVRRVCALRTCKPDVRWIAILRFATMFIDVLFHAAMETGNQPYVDLNTRVILVTDGRCRARYQCCNIIQSL